MEFDQQVSESGSSGDLGAAVEAISTEAPKLSGLDKLRAQKEYVEKNDAVPPKDLGAPSTPAQAARGTDGKFQKPAVPAATVPVKPAAPGVVPTPGQEGAPAPYSPDFKYKAGGKEMEIPKKFRALITDKESEEEVKKLFGQAATLDEFKANNATLKEHYTKAAQGLNQFHAGVSQLRAAAQKGDFDDFFKKVNIPPERIFQWVLDKVNYNQLSPEQRQQVDYQRNLQNQTELAQTQVSQASQRELQLATQVKGMQLDQTLEKADVRQMSEAFDSRLGRAGAFKEAIIEHAKSIWALSNRTVDLTPEQAVASFVQRYGNPAAFSGQVPAAGAANQTGNVSTPSATAATGGSANSTPPVKVIPNVAGRSASPIKQKPRNLDDLRRLAKEATERDNAQRNPSQGYLAG